MDNNENFEETPNLYDRIKKSTENAQQNVPYYQTFLIIILTVFLIFALLGINIFIVIGGLFQSAFDVIKPVTFGTINDFNNTAGGVINNSSDLLTNTGKSTLDILNGTFHDIGNLLIKSSNANTPVSQAINTGVKPPREPEPTNSSNPIQSSATTQWCLVGEYQDRRGCIEVSNEDKCLSGQIFPSQHQCLQTNKK